MLTILHCSAERRRRRTVERRVWLDYSANPSLLLSSPLLSCLLSTRTLALTLKRIHYSHSRLPSPLHYTTLLIARRRRRRHSSAASAHDAARRDAHLRAHWRDRPTARLHCTALQLSRRVAGYVRAPRLFCTVLCGCHASSVVVTSYSRCGARIVALAPLNVVDVEDTTFDDRSREHVDCTIEWVVLTKNVCGWPHDFSAHINNMRDNILKLYFYAVIYSRLFLLCVVTVQLLFYRYSFEVLDWLTADLTLKVSKKHAIYINICLQYACILMHMIYI